MYLFHKTAYSLYTVDVLYGFQWTANGKKSAHKKKSKSKKASGRRPALAVDSDSDDESEQASEPEEGARVAHIDFDVDN